MPSAMANSEKVAISSARVLPHEQARGAPAGDVDREVVVERPHRRGVAQQIPQRLEAVDDHDRGLLLLDAADDLGERLVDALASHHRAEVRDDHPLVGDQALVEEGELLHVADQLQRRFGQRRQVEALLSLAGLMEQHLQREDGLARARLARDDVDRAHRQPAAQDLVEGGAPRRQAGQAWSRGAQFASSGPPHESAGAKLGNLLEPADEDGPGQLHQQPPDLGDQRAERDRRPLLRRCRAWPLCDQACGSV